MRYITIFLLFISVSSCQEEQDSILCPEEGVTIPKEKKFCNNKIISYHFGLEKYSIPHKLETLYNLGIDGIITQVESENQQDINQYFENCYLRNNLIELSSIFTTICLNQKKQKEQLKNIDFIYKSIKNENTQLLLLLEGSKDKIQVLRTLAEVVKIANLYDKDIIIYPHEGLAIETAEEAMEIINTMESKNIFLSIHLCHELAANNGNRIKEVVNNVREHVKFISISGATIEEKNNINLPLWFWGIKPLNQGKYDLNLFYDALHKINYIGPIAIHTWGIESNFNLKIEEHIPHSRNILSNMKNLKCN